MVPQHGDRLAAARGGAGVARWPLFGAYLALSVALALLVHRVTLGVSRPAGDRHGAAIRASAVQARSCGRGAAPGADACVRAGRYGFRSVLK